MPRTDEGARVSGINNCNNTGLPKMALRKHQVVLKKTSSRFEENIKSFCRNHQVAFTKTKARFRQKERSFQKKGTFLFSKT
jgi:hypothetical protein